MSQGLGSDTIRMAETADVDRSPAAYHSRSSSWEGLGTGGARRLNDDRNQASDLSAGASPGPGLVHAGGYERDEGGGERGGRGWRAS